MRITPTILTIKHIWPVYEYAVNNNLNVESCNFLHHPQFMRPTVLPMPIRLTIADELEAKIKKFEFSERQVLNIRNPDYAGDAALQDAMSYVRYLREAEDEHNLIDQLVDYLKKLESNRNNTILDYLPEYEELFRTAGY